MPVPLLVGGLMAGASFLSQHSANRSAERIANQNYKSQQELLDWQKSAQQTTWSREDNAVQRRMSDMRAAGISPHAAAGGAAQASGPVGMKAPQRDPSIPLKGAANMQNMINSVANIAQTLAQTQVLQAEGKIKGAEAEVAHETKDAQVSSAKSDASIKHTQAQLSKETYQSAVHQFELINKKLNLENEYSMRTMISRVAEAADRANITKAEAAQIVDALEARLGKDKASAYASYKQAELTSKQIEKITDLMPIELELAEAKKSMELLKIDDYRSLPPRARTTIMLILGGLKAIL